MKVKVIISYEYHQPLVIEEVELDPPGENDVIICIAVTGICQTMFTVCTQSMVYIHFLLSAVIRYAGT